MSLVFFEGFDQNIAIGPLSSSYSDNISGYWDFNRYFWQSTLAWNFPLVEGRYGGQAIRTSTTLGSFGAAILMSRNNSAPNSDAIRLGFDFRTQQPSATRRVVSLGSVNGNNIAVSVDINNILQVVHSSEGSIGNLGTNTGDWIHLQIFYNQVTGQIQILREGALVLTANVPSSPTAQFQYALGNSNLFTTGHLVDFDNLFVTTGEAPSGIDGLQVAAIYEGYTAVLFAGLRGSLVIGDNQYQTDWNAVSVSSTNSTQAHLIGKNIGNVVNFLWETNPSTGQAWTRQQIDALLWGVCWGGTQEGETVRLMNLNLSLLDATQGLPRVVNYQPSVMTYYSGDWVKSDDTKTYSSLLGKLPRQDEVEVVNADYVLVSGPGCMLFSTVDPNTPDTAFGQVGLTFAEKTQVNHRDWTSVDLQGEPANAHFVSGYGVYGESDKKFQSNYVTVNYETIPTGSAYIQGVWDYSIDPDTGKWSMRQQVYGPKSSTEYKHAQRKLKIRGHGKALQLRVSSFGDAPFIINGWAVFVTSNTVA